MNNLRTLLGIAIGALMLTTVYGIFVSNKNDEIIFSDNGNHIARHSIEGDRAEFILKENGQTLTANWRGQFELNQSGQNISAVERRMTIQFNNGEVTQKVTLKSDDDKLLRQLWINETEQTQSAETENTIDDLVLRFLRLSGIKAGERVNKILEEKGVEGVLHELSFLQNNSALVSYIVSLASDTNLNESEISRLADILNGIDGDHDRRRATSVILKNQKLNQDNIRTLITLAGSITSDHDLQKLVSVFSDKVQDVESIDLLIDLISGIDSDHTQRKASEKILDNPAVHVAGKVRLLEAAQSMIENDRDKELILDRAAQTFLNDPECIPTWFETFNTLEKSISRRRSLESALDLADLDETLLMRFIIASQAVSESRDRRVVLEKIAETELVNSPELRRSYLQSAEAISTENERLRAVAAIQNAARE